MPPWSWEAPPSTPKPSSSPATNAAGSNPAPAVDISTENSVVIRPFQGYARIRGSAVGDPPGCSDEHVHLAAAGPESPEGPAGPGLRQIGRASCRERV